MKINEFYTIWPTIENKDIKITMHKNSVAFGCALSMRKSGLNVYLRLYGGTEIICRKIKSINLK